MRLAAAGAACAALTACATTPAPGGDVPTLRLSPASLERRLDLQQHITVQAAGREQQMDVLLEADPARVKLAVVALGQVAARIDWDGRTLTEWRSTWWPASVPGARILNDMQLSLWPLAAVQAALPAGWHASEDGAARTLFQDGEAVMVVRHPSADVIELEQRRAHYRLTVVSQPAGEAS